MIDKKILLVFMGSNALTATLCLGLASAVVRRDREELNEHNLKLGRLALENHKAVDQLFPLARVIDQEKATNVMVNLMAFQIDVMEFPK